MKWVLMVYNFFYNNNLIWNVLILWHIFTESHFEFCYGHYYPAVRTGSSNTLFFWWSLAPDLWFLLGQTNTSCRRSVNISTIFSRLASIHQNLHEKRCRELLAMQWHKTLFDESEEEDGSKLWRSEIWCRLCFRWLLDASQIQQW